MNSKGPNELAIGPGLKLIFALLIALILGGNALLFWQFHRARLQTERLTDVSQELIGVLRLQVSLLSVHQRLDKLAQSQDAAGLASESEPLRRTLLEETRDEMSTLSRLPNETHVDPEFQPTLQAIGITLPKQLEAINGLAASGDWKALRLRLDNELRPVESLCASLVAATNDEVSGELALAVTNMRRTQLRIFLAVALTAISTFFVAALLAWAVTRRIITLRMHERVEALRASEIKLREIVDSIPGFVCALSPEGEVELVNRQLLDYFGKTFEEMKSWSTNDSIHPDDRSRSVAAFTYSIKTGTPHEIEQRCRRADGVYRWFLRSSRPVRDTDGRITNWYVLITDIEDRKRAEDELRRSEAFLAQGQRLNLTGTFAWNLDTDERTFSEQLYHIFEFDPSVPVTLEQIGARVHPEDIPLLTEKMALARTDTSEQDYEFRLRMSDGRVKYLRTKSSGIRHNTGRLEHIGAIQDVTTQRLAEDALGKVRSELAHMTRVASLGALTASIAHEVNQPLSGIVTNASTCLRLLATDPPNIDAALETARRTIRDGRRAADVITRLRALFRKTDTPTEPVDLNEATREVLALSLSDLQRNRVILRQELADGLPQVTGDRVQLQQVILNLLLNASDAMNGIDDHPRQLTIRTEEDEDGCVRLTVQDTGVGIDPQNVDKLFEAFYTTKSSGMGIGLSISRTIIESHHGRLQATSNDGPGAAFSISIPRASNS
ncbi:MAG: ATP-binding protein [Terracidiphilus sp.]